MPIKPTPGQLRRMKYVAFDEGDRRAASAVLDALIPEVRYTHRYWDEWPDGQGGTVRHDPDNPVIPYIAGLDDPSALVVRIHEEPEGWAPQWGEVENISTWPSDTVPGRRALNARALPRVTYDKYDTIKEEPGNPTPQRPWDKSRPLIAGECHEPGALWFITEPPDPKTLAWFDRVVRALKRVCVKKFIQLDAQSKQPVKEKRYDHLLCGYGVARWCHAAPNRYVYQYLLPVLDA